MIGLIDAILYNSTGLFFVALGLLIAVRFVNYPDLTVDGSFTLGAAIYALTAGAASRIPGGLLISAAVGALAGMLTATLNQVAGIGKVVSSILVMISIVVLSPYLAGGSTLGVIGGTGVLQMLRDADEALAIRFPQISGSMLHGIYVLAIAMFAALLAFAVKGAFGTPIGATLRYVTSASAPLSSVRPSRRWATLVGLAAANAIVAIGGAIEADRQGGYTFGIGVGMILVALAILVLGESILKLRLRRDNLYLGESLAAIVIGVIAYSAIIQLMLRLLPTFVDVRLLTTVVLATALTIAARAHSSSARLF